MAATVTVVPVSDLYHRYPCETDSQKCYVELDCETGSLSAEWDPEIGGAVPARVWDRRALRWAIRCLRPEAADALLAEIAPLAQALCGGYSCRWDSHNHVGVLDAAAAAACSAIDALCDGCDADADCEEVWAAADWLAMDRPREDARLVAWAADLGVHAVSTASEIEAVASALETEAAVRDVRVEGLDRYLTALRTTLGEILLPECACCAHSAVVTDLDGDPLCADHAAQYAA